MLADTVLRCHENIPAEDNEVIVTPFAKKCIPNDYIMTRTCPAHSKLVPTPRWYTPNSQISFHMGLYWIKLLINNLLRASHLHILWETFKKKYPFMSWSTRLFQDTFCRCSHRLHISGERCCVNWNSYEHLSVSVWRSTSSRWDITWMTKFGRMNSSWELWETLLLFTTRPVTEQQGHVF